MTETVINQTASPVMLDDGTTVGAAYTPEARREGATLSPADRRRYVDVDPPVLVVVERPRATVEHSPAASRFEDKSAPERRAK